eukprot:627397-Pleurochrysis_carterae.AAC.1
MDHRFSPRRDQDPEGGAGGYGPGLGPEAYTKALGRMPPRLRKAVDRIVLTLGRVSVPGSLRGTPVVLSFLAP